MYVCMHHNKSSHYVVMLLFFFTLRTTSVSPESMYCGIGHRNAPCKAQEMDGKRVVAAKTARLIFMNERASE